MKPQPIATTRPPPDPSSHNIEWPTWILWATILTLLIFTLSWYSDIPGWLSTPLMVVLLSWYMSFQHELTHGHPTSNNTINRLLGLAPLAIWYPFDTYKVDHLKHHEDAHLTVPGVDTESNYITPEQAVGMGRVALWLYASQRTFLGRLLFGPAIVIVSLVTKTFRRVACGDIGALKVWAIHLPLVALLLWVLEEHTAISAWKYCFGMAYPALGLAMLRSLYEHRPGPSPAHRTVINHAGLFWRLLYLNNNYHAVHHAYPEMPWYRIPAAYATDREGYQMRNGGFVLPGYLWLIRKYAWKVIDSPVLSQIQTAPKRQRTGVQSVPKA
jgi:fatty acid desaturase